MVYRHVQWGWVFLVGIAGVVIIGASLLGDARTSEFVKVLFVLLAAAGVAMMTFLSRLVVTVDDHYVTVMFGWGWPRKVFALDDITTVRAVRNRWWYGFGIRKVPTGWMYNVRGLDAVDLALSSGKSFRIGTNDVEGLLAALPSRPTQKRSSGRRRRPRGRGRV